MSKISLREVKLINWYGFVNETIPLSDHMTLITGENESGKSTILDAIKYAYTGDTKFNEATSKNNTGIGKRNLPTPDAYWIPVRAFMQDLQIRCRMSSRTLH